LSRLASRRFRPGFYQPFQRTEKLGKIGDRARENGLSPAEQRVAELVADGRTNREVAAILVLGESTAETHPPHMYVKLGVRSTTELGHNVPRDREPAEQT
jgi:DNA-binding CsgD family transcriptional regulator